MKNSKYYCTDNKLKLQQQININDEGLSNLSSDIENTNIEKQQQNCNDQLEISISQNNNNQIQSPIISPSESINNSYSNVNSNKVCTEINIQNLNQKLQQQKQDNQFQETHSEYNIQIKKQRRQMSVDFSNYSDKYFSEDTQELYQNKDHIIDPKEFEKVDEHQIYFDYKRYLYIFLIHFFYYFCFGPLVLIIVYFIHGYALIYNLGFTLSKPIIFISQNGVYLFNTFLIINYFIQSTSKIYLVEILFLNILVALRASVIAGKYATLHPLRWKLYTQSKVPFSFMQYDYYQINWSHQDQKTVYQETYNSLLRGQYDTSLFYLTFYVNPQTQKVKTCEQYIQQFKKLHKKQNLFQPYSLFEGQKNQTQIYGYGIISDMINNFKKLHPQTNNFLTKSKITALLTLLRIGLLLIYRLVRDKVNINFNQIELIEIIGVSLVTAFTYYSQLIFLYQYHRDLKLKQYCQEQCSMMIDIKKQIRSYKKLFPTIDITNPYSLKSWSILRRVLFDYGQSFDLRMQTYFSINMVIFTITVIIFSLWFFGLYKFPEEYVVVSVYEITVWVVYLLIILYKGAVINSQFQTNLNILSEHRILALDLMRLRKQYFIDKIIPINFILKKAVQRMSETMQHKYKTDKIQEIWVIDIIENMLNSIEDCEKELQTDQQNRPFTFFQIKITMGVLQTIVAGLITLLGACANYYFINK